MCGILSVCLSAGSENTLVLSLHNHCGGSKVGQLERQQNISECVFSAYPVFVCVSVCARVCVKGQIDREMFQGEKC